MRRLFACMLALSGCVSPQLRDGTVRVTRDTFRGTDVVRAEMMLTAANGTGAITAVTVERGTPVALLSMRVGSDVRAPLIECFVEAAVGTQVFDLPRPTHHTEPVAAGFSAAYERFDVTLTLAQAEALFRGAPRFRICSLAFLPTRTQIETFHRFWDEVSPPAVPLTRAQR